LRHRGRALAAALERSGGPPVQTPSESTGGEASAARHARRTPQPAQSTPLLRLADLSVSLVDRHRSVSLLRDIALDVMPGEIVGVVGETGSGKSMTAKAILGLLDPPIYLESGRALFKGADLFAKTQDEMRSVRGSEIGVVFQNPKASLHPMLSIETQMTNVYRQHVPSSKDEARTACLSMLGRTGIADPARVGGQYPHQLSGGMAQRVMIAIALMCGPSLVIADEPTTGLDVTVQLKVLNVLAELLERTNAGALVITHDLGVVAQFCRRVVVLYGGRVMEQGTTDEIFARPRHPYTLSLLASSSLSTRKQHTKLNLRGAPFDLADPPGGCVLHPRCPFAFDRCLVVEPALAATSGSVDPHRSRCHIAEQLP
jgi:peptide/nickel transport system ATP-binding protein